MPGDLLRSTGPEAFPSESSSRKCLFSPTNETGGCCQPMRGFDSRENSPTSRSEAAAPQGLSRSWAAGFEQHSLLANRAKPRAWPLSDWLRKAASRHHAEKKVQTHLAAREQARATPEPNFASAQESHTSWFVELAWATTKLANFQFESARDSH